MKNHLTTLAPLAGAVLACAASTAPSHAESVVTGEARYLERIATPPGAVFQAVIEDVSRADAPAVELGRVIIADAGNPPWRFAIPFEPAIVDDRGVYAVRATLRVDGALWFASDTHTPVLTRGAGDTVEIVLRRVSAPERDMTLQGATWRLLTIGGAQAMAPGHAVFDNDGRVAGAGGCNRFMGGYVARDDGAFLAGRLASTMMACDDQRMAQEQAVFAAFEAARGWRIEGAVLTLSDADGAAVATFGGEQQ